MNVTSLRRSLLVLAVSMASVTPAGSQESADKEFQVGMQAPEVTVYEAAGDSVSLLQKLKGTHTVLVSGCLT
jgi:hypothetical protein